MTTRTIRLDDGRELRTSSSKRYHVVAQRPDGELVRVTSSTGRGRALSRWRTLRRHEMPAYLVDIDSGETLRTPDSSVAI